MSHELEFDVLDEAALEEELQKLEAWQREGPAIRKTFSYDSFLEAMAFVNRVAALADELDHHPDIQVSYKRVTMTCVTHKKNAVTKADVMIAGKIDALA